MSAPILSREEVKEGDVPVRQSKDDQKEQSSQGGVRVGKATASTPNPNRAHGQVAVEAASGQRPKVDDATRTQQMNNQMKHVTQNLNRIKSELDGVRSNEFVSSHRLRILQNALGDVESYRVEGIWVGRLPSGKLPEGQAALQEEFEKTASRLRELIIRDANISERGPIQGADTTSEQSRQQGAIEGDDEGEMSAELLPLFRTLSDMREQFRAYLSKKGALSDAELDHFHWLQYQLNHAESGMKHDGVWCGELSKGHVPAGQAKVQSVVESCHRMVHRINVDCEEHVKRLKPAQPKPTSREKKMWQEMTLVHPSLRLLYRTLVDISARLSTLAQRLRSAPSNTAYGELEKIKHRLNDLEERYKHNGVWYISPEEPSAGAGADSELAVSASASGSSASAASSAPSSDISFSFSSKIPSVIPSGQAILNRLIDSSHDLIDRLTAKRV